MNFPTKNSFSIANKSIYSEILIKIVYAIAISSNDICNVGVSFSKLSFLKKPFKIKMRIIAHFVSFSKNFFLQVVLARSCHLR